VLAPRLLQIALKDHVHGLKHQTTLFVLDIKDALGAQNVLPFFCQQLVEPAREGHAIDRLIGAEGNAGDFRIVDRVDVVVAVIVAMVMAAITMVMTAVFIVNVVMVVVMVMVMAVVVTAV